MGVTRSFRFTGHSFFIANRGNQKEQLCQLAFFRYLCNLICN